MPRLAMRFLMFFRRSVSAPLNFSVFSYFLHYLAHSCTPLFIFFEKAYAFGEHLAVHIIWITAKEVVHETSEGGHSIFVMPFAGFDDDRIFCDCVDKAILLINTAAVIASEVF